MANVLTVVRVVNDFDQVRVQGTVVFSGSYVQVAGAGELIDWTKVVMPAGQSLNVSKGPVLFDMWGNNGIGYGLNAAYGTAMAQKLKITTASNTELSAGGYPASITGDFIQFEVCFDTNI